MTSVDEYLDNALDGDDIFPCKGCGEILEEGKAFELAGHRWHLNCFRCNTCGTLLDSDANLLLLGDGSLICNNCTYSCNACGNKIEDLAILTGDQAFCATCFRCRNCKRKIENLRYARTSQGIFCMSCHESLMARRRKKHKAAAQAKAREKEALITEKSLPALPPGGPETPTEASPRPPRVPYNSTLRQERSPERSASDGKDAAGRGPGPYALSPPTYRKNRNSSILQNNVDVNSSDGDSFFIPVALDPSPAPSAPRSISDNTVDLADPNGKTRDREYFTPGPGDRRESQASTPHIAFQERNRTSTPSEYDSSSTTAKDLLARQSSKSSRSEKGLAASSMSAGEELKKPSNGRGDEFKLQDAPKSKRAIAQARNNTQSTVTFESGTPPARRERQATMSSSSSTPTSSTGRQSLQDTRRQPRQEDDVETSSPESSGLVTPNSRANVGDQQVRAGPIPRKELPTSTRTANGKPVLSPLGDLISPATALPPPVRPGLTETKLSDTYMQPRAPPQPPTAAPPHPAVKDSGASNAVAANGDATPASPPTGPSPKLPRWSAGGDFSLDEDMARILGTDESSSSILRRVSNAVRHGRNSSTESSSVNHHNGRPGHSRSLSETTRATSSPRWPKTPITENVIVDVHAHDISSPISVSGAAHDDPAFLKRQLRTSEQRVAELERQFGAEKDLKSLNKKLMEKRRTVSVLDTQAEIMIRQLEVLAGYVERAKATKQPIDAKELEDSAIKDFVQKLDELQKNMAAEIEQLHTERDELVDEKNQAVADRDRALLEFEQLSSKNAQLADMNNDLTHQIQERFKSQITSEQIKSPSGLGIYQANKGPSISSVNLETASVQTSTGATLIGTDVDETVVENGPTVVNMRKGQVRKFNWKKGSKTVAQNFSKGVNRAVGAFQNDRDRPGYPGLSGDSIGLPYNMTVASVDSPQAFGQPLQQANRMPTEFGPPGSRMVSAATGPTVVVTAGPNNGAYVGGPNGPNGPNGAASFAFFKKSGMPKSGTSTTLGSSEVVVAEAPNVLFGSDLVERTEFERRHIPSVVTRCIEEVELRGMDVEGIYRKTGGNSQVKAIREGFEKQDDFDISDPDLDITAVTSVLKQYFRKLPTPLLTYDVYDRILESNGVADTDERCAHLRKTINMLPQKHRDCLEFLMFHLARVANRERENLMSPKNLAVVFAPTIMRDHSLDREMTDMHSKNVAVQFVIENSNIIFSED
ncbi:Rho GTPase activator [Grosmannia clavigera kw1407]|uniref:Rho GTPase activator n=1 Tax=Grosmannia clavigera (strain kw1407 / UAMH 11150) TaxID=655863 RepID=F0XUI3_GROCL|nr:Rho GTPase activator [Grosmannia clavigera kw1407]EFW98738.1 Rho GTPase activator [Grosmannia clavigera kw1407]